MAFTTSQAVTVPRQEERFSFHQVTKESPHLGGQPNDFRDTMLLQYFGDVARLPVLRHKQEFEMAKKVDTLEVKLWTQILSNPELAPAVVDFLGSRFEHTPPALNKLRQSSRSLRAKALKTHRLRHDRLCRLVAKHIRAHDVDRIWLDAILEQLRRVAAGDRDTIFSESIADRKTFEDYHEKVLQLSTASQRARDRFIQANLRLVVTIASRFNFGHIPLQDLIQEGNIGLIKAVGRYDYRRGFRFSTYASWWIRHAITRAIADKGRLVRVPVHKLASLTRLNRHHRELSNKLGREPTSEEIGSSTSLSTDEVMQLQEYRPSSSFSLETQMTDEDDRRFIDLVKDESTCSPIDTIGDQQVLQKLSGLLGDLKPIESDILRKRFGLLDGREHTLVEIGETYELSRERIRQIQEQALGKVRRALMRQNAM